MSHPAFGRSLFGLLLCLALSLTLAPKASAADDVWRIAGTMNGWNLNDESWQMERHPDRSWVFRLEKLLEPGRHRFKFVRNGAWAQGHFGSAENEVFGLEQPGNDIPLVVEHLAFYRIELNTQDRRWRMEIAAVDEPIVRPWLYGNKRVAEPMILDLTDTIARSEPWDLLVQYDYDPQMVKVSRNGGPGSMTATVVPLAPGEITIGIRVRDGQDEGAGVVSFEAHPPKQFVLHGTRGIAAPASVSVHVTPSNEDGAFTGKFELDRGIAVTHAVLLSGDTEVDRVTFTDPIDIAPGVYTVQTRERAIRRMTDEGAGPLAAVGVSAAESWVRFTYPALDESGDRVRTVHLTGDFNGWAQPGHRGSVELERKLDVDGAPFFETWQRLGDGAHDYAVMVNTVNRVPDPTEGRALDDTTSRVFVGDRPNDFDAPKPNHINMDAVKHDPASPTYFTQISDGLGLVDLALRTLPGDVESVVAHVRTRDGKTMPITLRRERDPSGFDMWRARVHAGTATFSYKFELTEGSASRTTNEHTASLPDDEIDVPDWAKGAVYYQIFAERFRNGNPLNDPRSSTETLIPWNADWYTVSAEEEAAWRDRYDVEPHESFPEITGGPLFHVVWDRRYGGDLQGVVEKLDYLKDLGITAIYFNPVFEAQSMHKYDATDFRHIEDNFGTPAEAGRTPEEWSHTGGELDDPADWKWTAADRYFLDVLLPEAKKRGIRVVLDGVWNHTGRWFWAFEHVQEHGEDSKFADWFYCTFDEDGELIGWVTWDNPDPLGQGWLPKFRQTENRDLIPPVKQHIYDVTTRWMDPNGDGDPSDGIDGWRLDVPLDIGEVFWRDWRRHVKSINPEAVIIAEIWGEDEADPYLTGDHFDTQMHYPFAEAVTDWLGVEPGMTSAQLIERLELAFDNAPQTNLIHQNLFGSHDTDRYVSKLINPNRTFDGGNRTQDGDNYTDVRPSEDVYKKSLLGVAIQAGYMGAPMVYYGDEVGMWGADDPTNRKPFPWDDEGPYERPDEAADWELRDQYAAWLDLRHDEYIGNVLRFGDLRNIDTGDPDVFAFVRSLNGRHVAFVVNKSARASFDASAVLEGVGVAGWQPRKYDVASQAVADDEGANTFTVAPLEAGVYVFR
jgi:glycosidase